MNLKNYIDKIQQVGDVFGWDLRTNHNCKGCAEKETQLVFLRNTISLMEKENVHFRKLGEGYERINEIIRKLYVFSERYEKEGYRLTKVHESIACAVLALRKVKVNVAQPDVHPDYAPHNGTSDPLASVKKWAKKQDSKKPRMQTKKKVKEERVTQ